MILATNNKGKLKEIRKLLDNYNIFSLEEKNIHVDVLEDQDSFLGNAKKKAMEIYEISKEPTIADDSGICIDCLDGFPGVMTHRFLGEDATPRMRNEYLLKAVNKHSNRSAQVVCNLVYYDGKNTLVGEGVLNGVIASECRGPNGFGFDEIFEIQDGRTLAELSLDEKNEISARAMAIRDLKAKMDKLLK